MKIIRLGLGILLSMTGLLGVLFGVLAICDPISAQLADDHNPFAKPPTTSESIKITAIYIFISLAGLALCFGPLLKRTLNKAFHRIA
jgi:hypothetical protein